MLPSPIITSMLIRKRNPQRHTDQAPGTTPPQQSPAPASHTNRIAKSSAATHPNRAPRRRPRFRPAHAPASRTSLPCFQRSLQSYPRRLQRRRQPENIRPPSPQLLNSESVNTATSRNPRSPLSSAGANVFARLATLFNAPPLPQSAHPLIRPAGPRKAVAANPTPSSRNQFCQEQFGHAARRPTRRPDPIHHRRLFPPRLTLSSSRFCAQFAQAISRKSGPTSPQNAG